MWTRVMPKDIYVEYDDGDQNNPQEAHVHEALRHAFGVDKASFYIAVRYQNQTAYGLGRNAGLRKQIGQLALGIVWTILFDMSDSDLDPTAREFVAAARAERPLGHCNDSCPT